MHTYTKRMNVFYGTWRKSKDGITILPCNTLQHKESHELNIETLIVYQLDVPDEYDTTYICSNI
ncbi:MAG: hypothetical protein ACKPKO_54795, partial [Candidatus Fonsibacter sp.]